VLARVVRVATVDDYWRGRTIAGIAFQFLFCEEAGPNGPVAKPANQSAPLEQFLRHVVERDARQQGLAVQNWRGTLRTRGGEQAAAVSGLNLRGMAIETDYAVAAGETIRVEMPGAGERKRLSFDGKVLDCSEAGRGPSGAPRYRVTVTFGEVAPPSAPSGVAGESMDDAVASLLRAFTSLAPPPEDPSRARHLAGELSRISLVSVVTLCQIERVTGLLSLTSGTSRVRAYLRDGELVDASIEGRDVSARSALSEVITWKEGQFEVLSDDILRPDRLGVSTTMLLIDLAREMDEAGR
jgi:hypothetical protein